MPRAFVDRSGQKFTRLLVLGAHRRRGHSLYLECLCDCGNIIWASVANLNSGTQKSCGCLRRERWANGNRRTHGLAGTPIYTVWSGMKRRCMNSKNQDYADYGGRGIKVCDRWMNSFEAFYEDMADKYEPGLTLDRIDVNGNYDPLNCQWSTHLEQGNNKRNTRKIETEWGKITIRRASELSGLPITTIRNRIFKKWPVAEVLGPRRWADGHR